MESGLAIRRAGTADAEVVAALHAASWRSAYRGLYPDDFLDREAPADRRSFWLERMPDAGSETDALFLAELDGRPAGFVCLRRSGDPAGPLLDNLHVLPALKGRGIGRRMLRSAAEWLVALDPEAPLQLLVWAANAPARRFYSSLGAEDAGTIAGDLPGGGTAPEIRMRWPRAAALLYS